MKYRGITFDKNRGKWRAACFPEGRCVHLGRFDTAEEAARAYDAAAPGLLGDQAVTNFGRQATTFQEQCYRLCSPDFYGLPQWAAAKLLHTHQTSVCLALKRMRKRLPTLFPLRRASGRPRAVRYEEWMHDQIKEKF